jgi:hypothetical protein
MKKIISILAVLMFAFSYSQVNNTNVDIRADKDQIEKVYPKGLDKFKDDLSSNLQYTANDYQVLGNFKLDFSVNENGKISDIKISPKLFDETFEREVKRDVTRMAKNFASNQKENVSVNLSFSRGYEEKNERVRYASYVR